MQPLPALREKKEHGWAEREQHHRYSHSEADKGQDPGAAVVSAAGYDVGRYGDQQFQNAASEEQAADPGHYICGRHPAAHANEDKAPGGPGQHTEDDGAPSAPAFGSGAATDKFADGKSCPGGQSAGH